MSSGRGNNRHHAWIKYREEFASAFDAIGLPIAACNSEQSFADFLSTGRCEDFSLDALSEPQFATLFHIATSWFDCRAAGFTALEKRRLRGGSSQDSGEQSEDVL